MLRFQSGVQVQYFNSRLTPVFEYASAWGLRAHRWVNVTSIDHQRNGTPPLIDLSLSVKMTTDGDLAVDRKSLTVWLSRYLPLEYGIVLWPDHVHVEYDVHSRALDRPPARRSPPGTPG